MPKTKSLVFDTGPIISLATNNLLWILEPLKKKFKGEFYITKSIRHELVDKPLKTKLFEFEALQVMHLIRSGVLKVIENEQIRSETESLLETANKCFKARGNWMNILHRGELESLTAALYLDAEALVADERTIRLLLENHKTLAGRLRRKLHTFIQINDNNLEKIKKQVNGLKLIRSVELVTIAYKLGLLDKFLTGQKDSEKILLDAVLWGVKLHGCAVSREEINEIIRMEA